MLTPNKNYLFSGDLNSIFDEIFNNVELQFDFLKKQSDGFPVSDLLVNAKTGDMILKLALTGYSIHDVQLYSNGNILTVQVSTNEKDNKLDQDLVYIHNRIRKPLTFEKRFEFPECMDLEKVDVTFINGLMTIKIPRDKTTSKNKQIEIKC